MGFLTRWLPLTVPTSDLWIFMWNLVVIQKVAFTFIPYVWKRLHWWKKNWRPYIRFIIRWPSGMRVPWGMYRDMLPPVTPPLGVLHSWPFCPPFPHEPTALFSPFRVATSTQEEFEPMPESELSFCLWYHSNSSSDLAFCSRGWLAASISRSLWNSSTDCFILPSIKTAPIDSTLSSRIFPSEHFAPRPLSCRHMSLKLASLSSAHAISNRWHVTTRGLFM